MHKAPNDVAPTDNEGALNDKTNDRVTHAILSQAVLDAVSHLDSKSAFDMMLVNEHLQTQETVNTALKQEVTALTNQLNKLKQEQSEMFQYYKDQNDQNVAQIAALKRALAEMQEEKERLVTTARDMLENTRQEHAFECDKAQKEIVTLKDDLQHVHAFTQAKLELETHARTLETKLDAERVAAQMQVQNLERTHLLEQARSKQDFNNQMQVSKEEMVARSNDQVASTQHRILLENEHLTQELAFQSQEAEKILGRLNEAQLQVAKLRIEKKVLEANEALMAKKNSYYQKILAKLQQSSSLEKISTGSFVQEIVTEVPDGLSESTNDNDKMKQQHELERQLHHALEWLRVFQRERQFLLAQQDEVIQFLHRSLDEAMDSLIEKRGQRSGLTEDKEVTATFQATQRAEELIQLAPSITTMELFGRRILMSRPALNEVSSDDCRAVLLFLLEKLRLYQHQIATVYSSTCKVADSSGTSPTKQSLEHQLGVELPPIATLANACHSPLQKPRLLLHATAPDDVVKSKGLAIFKSSGSVKIHPRAPVSPQLLAMATNKVNFSNRTIVQKCAVKRAHHDSAVPTQKSQSQIQCAIPWRKGEGLEPWTGTTSTASIMLFDRPKT